MMVQRFDAAKLAQDAWDAGKRAMRVQEKDGVRTLTHPLKMKVSDMGQKLFDSIRPYVEMTMERIVASDARQIIQWADRELQTVNQEDIFANYHLLRDYLLLVGGTSPVPDLIHHQACMILVSVTYNLHSHVYARKGFRGLIRECASQEATRLKCMGAYMMHLTQKSQLSRDPKIFVLKTIIVKMHEKSGQPLKKRSSRSSQSVSSEASSSADSGPARVQDAYSGDSQPQDMLLVTPKMKKDLEQVRATEVQLLKSPDDDEVWASVRKVLDFRDELDDVVEVARSSTDMNLAASLELDDGPPCDQCGQGMVAMTNRSPLVVKALELPEFMKSSQMEAPSSSSDLVDKQKLLRDQMKEDKKAEEIKKDEKKRQRQDEKEKQKQEPKRPRGRPRKNAKTDDQPAVEVVEKVSKKRGQARAMSEVKAKKPKTAESALSQLSCTPKKSKRSPAKAWKPSPMAVKTHNKRSPKKVYDYQTADARTERAGDALKELHGAMKKVSGFWVPDLKSFSQKSYTIQCEDSGAAGGYPTIGVVLYSRNYHVARCGPGGWPNVASDFGLSKREARITVPWGEDPKKAFGVAKAIAGWP